MLKPRDDDMHEHDAATRRYRALFISDLHLGTKACQAQAFLDFLRFHDADRIFLIGDIVDFWRIGRGVYWPQAHNDVLQKLLRKARKGTDLVFIPGNHDEVMREYCGVRFGGIAIERNIVHTGADGRLPEYTTDLLDLLHVLGRLIALEPRQADLLGRICASRLLSAEELRAAGALAMPETTPASGRKKKGKAPRKPRVIRGKSRNTARAARKVRP